MLDGSPQRGDQGYRKSCCAPTPGPVMALRGEEDSSDARVSLLLRLAGPCFLSAVAQDPAACSGDPLSRPACAHSWQRLALNGAQVAGRVRLPFSLLRALGSLETSRA